MKKRKPSFWDRQLRHEGMIFARHIIKGRWKYAQKTLAKIQKRAAYLLANLAAKPK